MTRDTATNTSGEAKNATHQGSVVIAGVKLELYQLDDGRRIIDMDGVNKLLAALDDGAVMSDDDAMLLLAVKDGRTVMEKK